MNAPFRLGRVLFILVALSVLFLCWVAWDHFARGRRQTVGTVELTKGDTESFPLYTDLDARQIYEALIPANTRNSMLLFATSVQPTTCSPGESEMPDASFREALGAFHKINATRWDVTRVLGIELSLNESTRDSIFKIGPIDGWKKFHQQYPHAKGYELVSAVGFDAHRTAAIVYSEVRCGPKCGTGGFAYFRRTPPGWIRVQADIPNCRWIS